MSETGVQQPKTARKVLIPAAIVGCALACVVVIALLPAKEMEAIPTTVPPVNVEALVVQALPELPDRFDLPAVVEPNRVVNVAAEVPGRIERIPLQEGASCKEGDPLVVLNTDLLKADCDCAAAAEKNNTAKYKRLYNLHKDGAVTDRDLDQAQADMLASQAQLQAAQARLVRSTILAPIAGIVNGIPVEKGEYVQPGMVVAEIVDIATAKVVAQVPEHDVQFLQIGDQAQMVADVRGEKKEFAGTITYISELADSQTRASRLEIAVDNTYRFLRSGHIVRAVLTRTVLKNVVLVPLEAVIPMEDGKCVYVVSEGKAEQRDVKLGVIRGRSAQIVDGLAPGDTLIVSGHRFIAPGQAVNVVATDEGTQ